MTNTALLQPIVDLTQPMHEEHEIGAESAVDEKFAAPMAIRMLLPEQILLRPRDRTRDLLIAGQISSRRTGRNSWQRNYVRE